MANSEHLALIGKGVTTWNQWYKTNPTVTPDLSLANLSQLNLQGIDLRRANLTQVNFSNTDLREAKLGKANLNKASLLKTNLSNANLEKANLDYVIFSQAIINSQTVINRKYIQIYEIVNNLASDRNFSGCDLSNSNLFRVNLTDADLSNTNLTNANLTGATLRGTYLYKADLNNANLMNADLTNAYFSHANLAKAYLGGALCCGTYFKDADLSFANFKTTKFSNKTMIDFKWYSIWEIVNCDAVKRNLSGADLSNANLQGVNFKEANLTAAKLQNTILCGANLTNSDLTGANICGANFTLANLQGAKLKTAVNHKHKGIASLRYTQLSTVRNSDNIKQHSGSLSEEKPTTIRQATATQFNTAIPIVRSRLNKNIIILLFIGLITMFVAGTAIFLRNSSFSKPEIEPWEQNLKQIIPAN